MSAIVGKASFNYPPGAQLAPCMGDPEGPQMHHVGGMGGSNTAYAAMPEQEPALQWRARSTHCHSRFASALPNSSDCG